MHCQYAHVPKDERKKLDSKAKRCILLGYGAETKGYRLYDPEKRRVPFTAVMSTSVKKKRMKLRRSRR